ncbi:MAG: serine/threonine-protein kinase [Chloroflexota bacterium]
MEKGRILGGRYKIGERIGSGGMSTVYRAQEIGLEREVAVKVLLASLSVDQQLVERFNREAKTIAGLQHNSIIPIYYYGSEDDFGSYLVMPLLTGGTLDQRLEQLTIRPSITEVGEMAEKLGSALQYAHDRGIIHRDIKFSNIMFDEAGSAYLTDFGIAKLLNATNLTGTGMTVGTPQFMPPEQWRNDDVTPAVDQYALAVLLYAMLTQQMPFDASTPHALMYQHLQEEPPLASTVRDDTPQAIEDALHKALSKDPADRYESVTAFTNVIADSSRKTTREYSGFFQAPLKSEDNTKTIIGDTPQPIAKPNKLPNTPTKVIASPMSGASAGVGSGSGKTTVESGGQAQTKAQAKPQTQMVSEMETIMIDRRAFWGGIVTVLLIGVIGIGSWFFISQNNTVNETETAVFESTSSANETETQVAIIIAQATDTPTTTFTPEPTDEPSITPTASDTATLTPNATETESANQQATERASIRETGTALAEESTQQANDRATATESAFVALAAAEATSSTATTFAETSEAQTEIANLTATADTQNATATQESIDADSTATTEVERLNDTATAAVVTSTAVAEIANTTATAQANTANNTATAQAIDATSTAQVEARDATSTTEAQYREGTATALAALQDAARTQQASFDSTATALAIVPTPSEGIETEIGVAVEANANGERRLVYFFEGEQNQVVTISARSADFDTVIALYEGAREIADNDDGGYRLNSRIEDVRLPSDGIYTIELTAFNNEPMNGEFSLGVTELLTCPGLLTSRLYVGELARVTLDEGQNRLRAGTTREAVVVDAIPEGGVFEVLAGPVCDDIFTWYQVRWDDRVGWTAEGDPDEYWLEPLPEDDEPIVPIGGEGLTTGDTLPPGEFQVEYYCSRRGLIASTDTVDWFCDNSEGDTSFTLEQDDFDQICEDTYGIEDIFAQQEGEADEPAYQWQCFYYPE